MKSFIFIIFFLSCGVLYASNVGSNTGLEIPRYVSLKSNDSNIRIGPSINYPILKKYTFKNYPLLIIEEYKDWRKISDIEKNEGWIHKSLIKSKRNGIINHNNKKNVVKIYNSPQGKEIGEVHNQRVVEINKCKTSWCEISIEKYRGWIEKENLWGVKEKEVFNIGYFQFISDIYWNSFNKLVNILAKL